MKALESIPFELLVFGVTLFRLSVLVKEWAVLFYMLYGILPVSRIRVSDEKVLSVCEKNVSAFLCNIEILQ